MRFPSRLVLRMAPLLCGAIPFSASAAWNHFDPTDTSKVPKVFSATGFYSNMAAKTVTAEAVHFDVNSPLWSDNAAKNRWIILKPGSAKVQFDPAKDYYEYPDGAVFVKLFQHDTIAGSSASRIYWETRVLVNKKKTDTISTTPLEVVTHDDWHPFTYKWKRDGSEATLVKGGLDTSLSITVKGVKTFRKWRFPSTGDCNFCHRQFTTIDYVQGRAVLGFFAAQLNRPTATDASLNQIRNLFQKNILGWTKAVPTESEIAAMPKWARLEDNNASLDVRARAYIASNCSGCHGERGNATAAAGHISPLDYDFHTLVNGALKPGMELRYKLVGTYGLEPVVTSGGDTLNPVLVYPGRPELSVLLHRMKSRNRSLPTEDTAFAPHASQMPPVGVFEVDTTAIQVVTQWIMSLPTTSIRGVFGSQGSQAGHSGRLPVIRGNLVLLPQGVVKARLFGLDGQRLELTELPGHSYRLPAGLAPGIYILRAGSQVFRLML